MLSVLLRVSARYAVVSHIEELSQSCTYPNHEQGQQLSRRRGAELLNPATGFTSED